MITPTSKSPLTNIPGTNINGQMNNLNPTTEVISSEDEVAVSMPSFFDKNMSRFVDWGWFLLVLLVAIMISVVKTHYAMGTDSSSNAPEAISSMQQQPAMKHQVNQLCITFCDDFFTSFCPTSNFFCNPASNEKKVQRKLAAAPKKMIFPGSTISVN